VNRRKFIFGTAALGLTSATSAVTINKNCDFDGTIEVFFRNPSRLKGKEGDALRRELLKNLVVRTRGRSKPVNSRLIAFRVVKGKIVDQFISSNMKVLPADMLIPGDMFIPGKQFLPGDMLIPGDMYIPGNMYVPGDMFKQGFVGFKNDALRSMRKRSGFYFAVVAEVSSVKSLGAALPT